MFLIPWERMPDEATHLVLELSEDLTWRIVWSDDPTCDDENKCVKEDCLMEEGMTKRLTRKGRYFALRDCDEGKWI